MSRILQLCASAGVCGLIAVTVGCSNESNPAGSVDGEPLSASDYLADPELLCDVLEAAEAAEALHFEVGRTRADNGERLKMDPGTYGECTIRTELQDAAEIGLVPPSESVTLSMEIGGMREGMTAEELLDTEGVFCDEPTARNGVTGDIQWVDLSCPQDGFGSNELARYTHRDGIEYGIRVTLAPSAGDYSLDDFAPIADAVLSQLLT